MAEQYTAKYKRVLLKISGEALAGGGFGYDWATVDSVCAAIAKARAMGVQIAVVVGGGNYWRGAKAVNMDRTKADHMGMLATVMNCLAVSDRLESVGVPTSVMTMVDMPRIADPFTCRGAKAALEAGKVVFFGCGTGSPYFSTDTGAVLKAVEIGADAILMAKNIDGVYTGDPKTDPSAKKFETITYQETLEKGLRALDLTATALAKDSGVPTLVFALKDPENICRVLAGEPIGTVVKS